VTFLLGLLTLRETCLPVITQRKRSATLSKICPPEQDIENDSSPMRVILDPKWRNEGKRIKRGLLKPFSLLWNEPVVQILAVFTGYLFGLNHLTITTFQSLWRDIYQQDSLRASWNYGFIAVGFVLGSQITGAINDKVDFTSRQLSYRLSI
jgi:hypothetical protein